MQRRLVLAIVLAAGAALIVPTEARAQDEEQFKSWTARAQAASDRKDFAEAERCYYEAARFGLLEDYHWQWLREAEVYQGKLDEAVRNAQTGFRLKPSAVTAGSLCWAYIARGDFEAARVMLRRIMEMPDRDRTNHAQIMEGAGCRDYQFSVGIDTKRFGYDAQERFKRLGYYECYIPTDVAYQRSRAVKVEGALRYEEGVDKAGNHFVSIWPDGDKHVTVSWITTLASVFVEPRTCPMQDYRVRDEDRWLLGPASGSDPTWPAAQRIAAGLRAPDALATVKRVMSWWRENVRHYDTLPVEEADARNKRVAAIVGPACPEGEFVLNGGATRCGGITLGMCALFRACGIAARWVLGLHVVPESGWHTWPEIYLPGSGWIPVDDGMVPLGRMNCLVKLAHAMPERADENANGAIFSVMAGETRCTIVRCYADDPPWLVPPPVRSVDAFGDAQEGHLADVEAQLADNPSLLREKDIEYGATLLHFAAFGGKAPMVTTLLAAGAEVNARNYAGRTALHNAAFSGADDVAKLLLARGADPTIRDAEGRTPRDWAVEKGHASTAAILAEAGEGLAK